MGPVGDILGVGASLADATATDALAFAPAPTPAFLGDGMDALTQDFSFGEYVSVQRPTTLSHPIPHSVNATGLFQFAFEYSL
jgi:hypothetical protein